MGNSDSIPSNYGFKVVEILDQSPGAQCGLILNTDFVLTVNGKKLRKMTPETIKELVQNHEDKEMLLKVYNTAAGQVREVHLTPSRNWPGTNLLGIKIRLEPFGDSIKMDSRVSDPNFSYDDVYLGEKRSSSVGDRSNVFTGGYRGTSYNVPATEEPAPAKKKSILNGTLKMLGMKKKKQLS